MKRKILIGCLSLLVFLCSCEKEIMKYEGREGVYFAVQHGSEAFSESNWPYQPYSPVQFIRINQDAVNFRVKVMITGPVKDYDRTFRVEVNPDSTTAVLGVHYEALKEQWTIPAHAVFTNIEVRLKRTPDLETEEKTLGLRLVATKDFSLSFPEWDAIPSLKQGVVVPEFDASLHTLRISDIMVKPAVWPGGLATGTNRETGTMGFFTKKKMGFLTENFGLKYEDFASTVTMPMARISLIMQDASAILIRRFNEGNPVLEEDGRLMYIGIVPWTSTLGVPYVK
ncbi:hypothetical protein D3C87_207030 [compost metagenome]